MTAVAEGGQTAPLNRGMITLSIMLATLMQTLDSTIANVALPHMQGSMAASQDEITWVLTSYIVAAAIATPLTGWLADRYGMKRLLGFAIAGFTVASALCGLATSLPELVAFRALQGLGGGTLIPVGMTMITRTFPPAERIKANQVLIVPTLLAPALGPVIGGALVDGLSWRWIFYLNLPVGVAALLVGLLFLPAGSEHQVGRFDLPGFLLAAAGFPLLMFALSTGSADGWASAAVLGTGLPGLVLLAAFIAVERRVAEPLLRLRLYRDRLFRVTSLQLTFAAGGFMGTLFLVPLLLQNGLGFSAIHSGLSTFTEALGGMAGVQLTTRLYKRAGPRRLMAAGMSGAVTTIGLMALAGPSDAFWMIPLSFHASEPTASFFSGTPNRITAGMPRSAAAAAASTALSIE